MDSNLIQAWHDKLAALLARAGALPKIGEEPLALARELEDFTHQHPPIGPDDPAAEAWTELDRIARQTHDDLVRSDVAQLVTDIAARTGEFAALSRTIRAQGAANTQAAKAISLEQVTSIVSAANVAVIAITALRAEVVAQTGAPGQLKSLEEKLTTALAALHAFKSTVDPKA